MYYNKRGMTFPTIAEAVISDISNKIEDKTKEMIAKKNGTTDDIIDAEVYECSGDSSCSDNKYTSSSVKADTDSNTINIIDTDGRVIESCETDERLQKPMDDTDLMNTLNGESEDGND
jgi:hypothetical protein